MVTGKRVDLKAAREAGANPIARGLVDYHAQGKIGAEYIARQLAEGGAKVIFCHMGDSVLSLTEEDVKTEMLDGIRVFYTAMQPGRPALKLARLCLEKGIPVVCNLQVEPEFLARCGTTREMVDDMLSLSGLVVTFKHGLIRHTGQRDIEAAVRTMYNRHHPVMGLIVTLGEEGALWFDGNSVLAVPAFTVDSKDTTGAGDAFLGGLIHARFFQGLDRGAAMKFANACAALKCTQPGPRLKASKLDILAFMEQHGQEGKKQT